MPVVQQRQQGQGQHHPHPQQHPHHLPHVQMREEDDPQAPLPPRLLHHLRRSLVARLQEAAAELGSGVPGSTSGSAAAAAGGGHPPEVLQAYAGLVRECLGAIKALREEARLNQGRV